MKKGTLVKFKHDEKTGVSHGPTFQFGVWWILVEWDESKSKAIVLESALDVIKK